MGRREMIALGPDAGSVKVPELLPVDVHAVLSMLGADSSVPPLAHWMVMDPPATATLVMFGGSACAGAMS